MMVIASAFQFALSLCLLGAPLQPTSGAVLNLLHQLAVISSHPSIAAERWGGRVLLSDLRVSCEPLLVLLVVAGGPWVYTAHEAGDGPLQVLPP